MVGESFVSKSEFKSKEVAMQILPRIDPCYPLQTKESLGQLQKFDWGFDLNPPSLWQRVNWTSGQVWTPQS